MHGRGHKGYAVMYTEASLNTTEKWTSYMIIQMINHTERLMNIYAFAQTSSIALSKNKSNNAFFKERNGRDKKQKKRNIQSLLCWFIKFS